MELTEKERSWLAGDEGDAKQWAMQFNYNLGTFFGAEKMLPVASAHFAPDLRMGGDTSVALLEDFVKQNTQILVEGYLDPCHIDFEKEAKIVGKWGVSQSFVEEERQVLSLCKKLGFRPTQTCIPYQTVSPPKFGEHLSWGDTGAAICANSMFGARTNFEGGPSALASALIGRTPAYGLHLTENRRGNHLIEIECDPVEIADWGAIAALSGEFARGYDTVPVFTCGKAQPSADMVKQLGVALASFGGNAMFHLVGVTPEAPSLEVACQGVLPEQKHVISQKELDAAFARKTLSQPDVDLVVFAAPQLSIEEVEEIVERLDNRRVHENTRLVMAVDLHVKAVADRTGLTERVLKLGAEFSSGTCFYPEAPLLRKGTGWRSVVTHSAKLVNTLASAGYETALRRLDDCLTAAVTGKLNT